MYNGPTQAETPRRKYNLSDVIFYGIISVLILVLCVPSFFVLRNIGFITIFMALLAVTGVITLIFAFGSIVTGVLEWLEDRKYPEKYYDGPEKSDTQWYHPTLYRMIQLERKCGWTTAEFITLVNKDQIQFRSLTQPGIDNLDYIEWIGIVNELPKICSNFKKEGK